MKSGSFSLFLDYFLNSHPSNHPNNIALMYIDERECENKIWERRKNVNAIEMIGHAWRYTYAAQ